MHKNLLVGILTMALIALPLSAKISSAGGGGGCSGLDNEGECYAVVFGTAAALIIVTVLFAYYAGWAKNQPGHPSIEAMASSGSQVAGSAEESVEV